MKKILMSLMVLAFLQTLSIAQIVSTTSGGNWSDTSTWIGGVVPTVTDDVIVDGVVVVDTYPAECKNFTISENGMITRDSRQRNLYVFGDMVNNGSTDGSPFFNIYISGNLLANGSWASNTFMGGTENQTVTILKYASFNTIDFDAKIDGSSYQWYKDDVAITGDFPGANISGQSSKILHMFIGDNRIEGVYKCEVDGVDSRTIIVGEQSSDEYNSISGKVTNALDGTPISGALVAIENLSTTTDADGNYEITDIPAATLNAAFSGTPFSGDAPLEVMFTDQSNDAAYTLVISATGFSTYTNNQVVIGEGETLSLDASLSPTLTAGEMRIVLNWGSAPNDLDSYLRTPIIGGSEHTVYFSNKGSVTDAPYATLDHDDMNAFGPETITIYQKSAGTYYYYVNNYSGSPDISTSNGVVQVYTDAGLVSSVNIPITGTGNYWNVLTIDGTTGNVSIVNTIDSAPNLPTAPPTIPNKAFNAELSAKLAHGTQAITSWAWSFGDGETSTEQNPTHTYTVAGDYTVTLVASNGTDNATETKTNYISVSAGSSGGAIVSTSVGGWWHETSTWVGGILPTVSDDVIIDGTVKVKNTWPSSVEDVCNNLTINSGASLYGDELGNYAAAVTINGNLVNNGSISQNGTYFDFILTVKGSLTNNGLLANKTIWMQSTNAQTLTSSSQVEVFNFEMKNGQNLIAGSDLAFIDTHLKFNNGEFIIDAGKTVSFYSTSGGYGNGYGHLDKGHIKGGGTIYSSGFDSTPNVYWFNDSTTVENITLTGNIRGKGEFTILGNVINKDTLQQAEHNYPVTIKIEENFINNGVVRDNPTDNDHLELSIRKDIINNGDWKNTWVTMEGTTDQTFTNNGTLNSSFRFKANVTSATTYQWFKDGIAIDGAVEDDYEVNKYIEPENYDRVFGEFYCQTNVGNSRTISIIGGSSGGGEILTENFDGTEFPPSGWTQGILNSSNTWGLGNPENNNFTTVDATNVNSAICPWVAEDQDEWLKTPVLNLPDDAIELEFYAGYSTSWLSSATMKLNISIDGGNNWTKIWEATDDSNGWIWRNIVLDLSSYANNSNAVLGWQYVGNDGDLVGIDNVKLIYGTVGVEQIISEIPTEFALNQNYPNPFNPSTIISYNLPKQGIVTLNIYNILGQKVASLVDKVQNAGIYKINFNASNLSSGTYIYQIKSGSFVQSKKMLLIK